MARGGSGAMDQLYNNDSPAFTTWVIENDLLKEPFVVTAPGIRPRSHAHGPAQYVAAKARHPCPTPDPMNDAPNLDGFYRFSAISVISLLNKSDQSILPRCEAR